MVWFALILLVSSFKYLSPESTLKVQNDESFNVCPLISIGPSKVPESPLICPVTSSFAVGVAVPIPSFTSNVFGVCAIKTLLPSAEVWNSSESLTLVLT